MARSRTLIGLRLCNVGRESTGGVDKDAKRTRKEGTRVTMSYCVAFWEKGRADRGDQQKGDGLSVSRNCFETCLMEGCLSGTHDVIHLLQPGKNVRAQHGYEWADLTSWVDPANWAQGEGRTVVG